jgi:hypothetical protein
MLRTRHRIPPAALAAAALLAVVPAADARQASSAKWRITSVDIHGTHAAEYREGDMGISLYGTVDFKSSSRGKPFTMKLSQPRPKVIEARKVDWTLDSAATLSYDDKQWDCSVSQHDTAGLVAVLMVRPGGITAQWSLAPAGYACPAGAPVTPAFDIVPTESMLSRIPLRKFRGDRAVLPIDIHWEGAADGWSQDIDWKGKVVIRRNRSAR